jgi:hypothetical protein
MSQGPSAAAATTSAKREAIIIVPFELTNHLVCVDGCGCIYTCKWLQGMCSAVQCSMAYFFYFLFLFFIFFMSGCGQPYAYCKKMGKKTGKKRGGKGNRVTSE